jgi:hypothetical protein
VVRYVSEHDAGIQKAEEVVIPFVGDVSPVSAKVHGIATPGFSDSHIDITYEADTCCTQGLKPCGMVSASYQMTPPFLEVAAMFLFSSGFS